MNSSLPHHKMIPPGCEVYITLGGRLQELSPWVQGVLIFLITIHILTCPMTALLNALVIITVKSKSRLRAHKSNIVLALLSTSDLAVGIVVQPVFTALLISLLLDQRNGGHGFCALQVFTKLATSCLGDASLIHLAIISGERYLAMKHPFTYITSLTETRLLIVSGAAWLFSITLHIPLVVDNTTFLPINNAFIALSIAFVFFCHVIVYRETRRHEKQLAAQQVTQQARKQLAKDKKTLKLTAMIVVILVLCYMPILVSRILLLEYRSKITLETVYIVFFSAVSMALLNSLLNPIVYSVRMRQFRVAFIELTCKTVNAPAAEETERRGFGAASAVVRLEAGQEYEGVEQKNMEQENRNNITNHNNKALPQCRNYVAEQANTSKRNHIHYRHSI